MYSANVTANRLSEDIFHQKLTFWSEGSAIKTLMQSPNCEGFMNVLSIIHAISCVSEHCDLMVALGHKLAKYIRNNHRGDPVQGQAVTKIIRNPLLLTTL